MRADVYLYEYGYAESRQKAKSMITGANVMLNGRLIVKPSFDIEPAEDAACEKEKNKIEFCGRICPYVSRGGLKLEYALDVFGISVKGRTAADLGASTGGFTDCLLKRGIKKVYAYDCGHDVMDPKIKNDPRVVCTEKFNVRRLTSEDVVCDMVVSDLSFISQTKIYGNVSEILSGGDDFISLIKPQFEVGKDNVGKNGIVKNKSAAAESVARCALQAEKNGLYIQKISLSPILGGDGNTEFVAHFIKSSDIKSVRYSPEQIRKITAELIENGMRKFK